MYTLGYTSGYVPHLIKNSEKRNKETTSQEKLSSASAEGSFHFQGTAIWEYVKNVVHE